MAIITAVIGLLDLVGGCSAVIRSPAMQKRSFFCKSRTPDVC